MLPESAFPGPLPMQREAALKVLDRLDDFDSLRGTFLCFVMIRLEERFGEWRYAGVSESLADAVRRVEEFARTMLGSPESGFLRSLFGMTWVNEWNYPQQTPIDGVGPHRLVLCVRSDAPYDDVGACIVEIPSLVGSPFEGRLPETTFPEEWRESAVEWVLEKGTERFGPPSPEIAEALAYESQPEDWMRWTKNWEEVRSWRDLLRGS
jgi:hypothetical protein